MNHVEIRLDLIKVLLEHPTGKSPDVIVSDAKVYEQYILGEEQAAAVDVKKQLAKTK